MAQVKLVPRFPDLYSRTHSMKKFCATWRNNHYRRIWQSWAACDGKKAPQPSLASAQIPLNIIRKRATQFMRFSSLPALGLSLGTGTELHRLWSGHFSGPEMPLSERSPRGWRPAGGKLIHALGTVPGPRRCCQRLHLQAPCYPIGHMCFPTPSTGAESTSKNLGAEVRWVIVKGRHENDSTRVNGLLFTHPEGIPKCVGW